MKILIIYASIEGQTRKIAQTMASTLEAAGHSAALANAGGGVEFGLERPDAVFLAAPIHAGRYPTPFVDLLQREQAWLSKLPIAFVSVTLAIRSDHEDEQKVARGFADALVAETGLKPLSIHHAAGALRFTEYDFFKRWVMRSIAEKEGQTVDTSKDIEYTDWAALKAFVEDFLVRAAQAKAA